MRTLRATMAALMIAMLLAMPALADGDGGQNGMTVVAQGLDNPRHLTIGEDGAIYVAEAGRGGDQQCVEGPEGGEECFGRTGAVTRIADGEQERIATEFLSRAARDGSAATGPHDVAFLDGQLYVLVGLGAAPEGRVDADDLGPDLGRLFRLEDGERTSVADLSAYEDEANPDGGEKDSNPFALEAHDDGFLVVDAGGNDLLRVGEGGDISTVAVFPSIGNYPAPPNGQEIPAQSVPNSVAIDPDGDVFVGELTGFPFPVGAAKVYRVPAGGGDPEVYAEGFTHIIDLEFGPDGNLYVLQLLKKSLLEVEGGGGPPSPDALTGALIRVSPDGTKTEIASAGLIAPTGLAIADDGTIYVSNFGIIPGQGQVVRLAGMPGMPGTGGGALAGGGVPLSGVAGAMALLAAGVYGVRRRR